MKAMKHSRLPTLFGAVVGGAAICGALAVGGPLALGGAAATGAVAVLLQESQKVRWADYTWLQNYSPS